MRLGSAVSWTHPRKQPILLLTSPLKWEGQWKFEVIKIAGRFLVKTGAASKTDSVPRSLEQASQFPVTPVHTRERVRGEG